MSSNNQINDDQTDLKKEEMAENIIKKWLTLQKTIKEEITLEDVIISQQKSDFNHLKDYFKEYYTAKLNIRKTFDDIRKMNQNDFKNIKELNIDDNIDKILMQTCEPIKNLLFLFRNDYNYIIKLVSLIDEQDEEDKIESLVQLFCNQFYDNILIPNPEQEELLLLIYKLFAEEITLMNSALIDDFLNESTFLGKFCSTYMNKQEFKLYLSILINPLILSIDNENDDCLDMSLLSIRDYIRNINKERKSKNNENEEINVKDILFNGIPQTKIIFKKINELEVELEEESQRKNNNELQNEKKSEANDDDVNKNVINENNDNKEDLKYSEEYKEELTLEKLCKLIKNEKNNDIKEFYKYQLEQINNETDIFSNEGLLEVLEEKCFKDYQKQIVTKYKSNFLFIQKKIDFLLQSLIDKISTIPYTVRCICKIIYLLITKKFPLLPKYIRNSFVGKFIFEKSIFPVLSLENKNIMENKILGIGTKNCLDEIINILANANKCMLFNCNNDTERTIFNYYLIEIIPILNKFYDKLIDVKLPKMLDALIKNEKLEFDENLKDKIYFFGSKQKMDEVPNPLASPSKTEIIQPYDYFKENSDEILHLQCICFSMQDILFIMNLINKNIKIFSNFEKYDFFCKTVERIQSEEFRLDREINKDQKNVKFFLIFQDEKNAELEKLIVRGNKVESNLVGDNQESDLVCRHMKFCIKTILKGLNLLNNKDFTYLNMATSTDKFLTALKYILEDLGELNEMKNKIPLKWYGQYIFNNKKQLKESYQKNDFEQLYDEIYNEEMNILDKLKMFSSIIITRDGMNLRCAEKILEKIKYDLRHIKEAKKFLKIEKFVDSEEIEVCITTREYEEHKEKMKSKSKKNKDVKVINTQPGPAIIIIDGAKCEHKIKNNDSINDPNEQNNQNKKIPSHAYSIKEFINKFSDTSPKDKNSFNTLSNLVKEDINRGNRKNQIYASFENYLDIVKSKIKNSKKNKDLFENITDKEVEEISDKIEDHILRKIYKYIYGDTSLENDKAFYNKTLCLDWVEPEQLEIKKAYVNQLGYAELCIKKMNEVKSVFDKLNCIKDAHTNMNNTIKFSSGKIDDAGQDELTPIFQYIVIRARPQRIYSDIHYIKTFLGDSSLRGQEGFLVTQMESATSFIMSINHEQLKMSKEEYDKKIKEAEKRHGLDKQI
jgi:hypothetical protein